MTEQVQKSRTQSKQNQGTGNRPRRRSSSLRYFRNGRRWSLSRRTVAQFQPPPPPDLTSAEYAAAFDQVKELGAVDSPTRTADQTQIALFWINGPGTATPPGHWNVIAQVAAEQAGNTLLENARLFAAAEHR